MVMFHPIHRFASIYAFLLFTSQMFLEKKINILICINLKILASFRQ
ncbi:unnamed protein product [Brugia timori]|uniref:Uncharacterized protein n=1 Tax=Brugia timori TaxID=42155 RepID=A0A3P7ZPX5_9BILA|nr:unnamed protein product [Brugia timori]